MVPSNTIDERPNGLVSHTKHAPQLWVRDACKSEPSDFTYFNTGQFVTRRVLTDGTSSRHDSSTLCVPIERIISHSSKKQMVPVNTRWVVTFMTNEQVSWVSSVFDVVGDTRRKVSADVGIILGEEASPFPAISVATNDEVVPEGFKRLWLNVCKWFRLTSGHVGLLDRLMCLGLARATTCAALSF